VLGEDGQVVAYQEEGRVGAWGRDGENGSREDADKGADDHTETAILKRLFATDNIQEALCHDTIVEGSRERVLEDAHASRIAEMAAKVSDSPPHILWGIIHSGKKKKTHTGTAGISGRVQAQRTSGRAHVDRECRVVGGAGVVHVRGCGARREEAEKREKAAVWVSVPRAGDCGFIRCGVVYSLVCHMAQFEFVESCTASAPPLPFPFSFFFFFFFFFFFVPHSESTGAAWRHGTRREESAVWVWTGSGEGGTAELPRDLGQAGQAAGPLRCDGGSARVFLSLCNRRGLSLCRNGTGPLGQEQGGSHREVAQIHAGKRGEGDDGGNRKQL